MIASILILILILVWIVVGVIGFVVHGLFWLVVFAGVAFLLTLLGSAFQRGRRSWSRTR